jgi:hypothetical protein
MYTCGGMQGPSVSSKFYLSIAKNQTASLKVTVHSPLPKPLHLGDTIVSASDEMQIFELPYEVGMNVVRVDVRINGCSHGEDTTQPRAELWEGRRRSWVPISFHRLLLILIYFPTSSRLQRSWVPYELFR